MNRTSCLLWKIVLLLAVLSAVNCTHAFEEPVSGTEGSEVQDSMYAGLGLAQHHLYDDHPSIGSRSGSGIYALFGWMIAEHWRIELSTSGSGISVGRTCDPATPTQCTIYYPEDSAEYFNLLMLVRRDIPIPGASEWRPWIAVGRGYHFYSWDTYAYMVYGSGSLVQTGVDMRIAKAWDLRVDLAYARYEGSDDYDYGPYKGTNRQLGTALVFRFR